MVSWDLLWRYIRDSPGQPARKNSRTRKVPRLALPNREMGIISVPAQDLLCRCNLRFFAGLLCHKSSIRSGTNRDAKEKTICARWTVIDNHDPCKTGSFRKLDWLLCTIATSYGVASYGVGLSWPHCFDPFVCCTQCAVQHFTWSGRILGNLWSIGV